jgi:hypothetical protein
VPPALHTLLDGNPLPIVACPEPLAPRAWALGVVAVQLTVAGGRLSGQLRLSVTGSAAHAVALAPIARVHVALGAPPSPFVLEPPAQPGVALFLDGAPLDAIALPSPAVDARAFAHVYCRWLRTGEREPGFDLTDFLSLPPGVKYDRRLHRPLAEGSTVGYCVRLA